MDTDVDAIDIDYENDAGIFSIANDNSEEEYSPTDDDAGLSVVRTKRTAANKDDSAEEFLLAREESVRFISKST